MIAADLSSSLLAGASAADGFAQHVLSSAGVTDALIGATAVGVTLARRWWTRKQGGPTAAPDAGVMALRERLASLPAHEAMPQFLDGAAQVVGEMREQNRTLAEMFGRARREWAHERERMQARITELERQVATFLAAADEFEGMRMGYVSRNDELEARCIEYLAQIDELQGRVRKLESDAIAPEDHAVARALEAQLDEVRATLPCPPEVAHAG